MTEDYSLTYKDSMAKRGRPPKAVKPTLVGRNLMRLRGSMEQSELARRTGNKVTQATISRIENGADAKVSSLIALAGALDASIIEFFREQPTTVADPRGELFFASEAGKNLRPEVRQRLHALVWPVGHTPTVDSWRAIAKALEQEGGANDM